MRVKVNSQYYESAGFDWGMNPRQHYMGATRPFDRWTFPPSVSPWKPCGPPSPALRLLAPAVCRQPSSSLFNHFDSLYLMIRGCASWAIWPAPHKEGGVQPRNERGARPAVSLPTQDPLPQPTPT